VKTARPSRTWRPRALAGIVIAVALSWSAAVASAVSPAPAPPASLATVQAWLDADFTPDAPPGGKLEAGITFWDTGQLALAPVVGVYARLKPAKGKAAASEGTIRADFPGHVVAEFVVPAGGPGALVVGVHGADGDADLEIAGVGPPPGAKVFDLVSGSIHDIVGDVVAGRPFSVTVDVLPRGEWDVTTVGLSDRVDVMAIDPTDRSATELGTATLQQQGGAGTPYAGMMTIRATGNLELAVALSIGGAELVIAGEHKPVTVLAAGIRPSTAPAATEQAAPAPARPDPAATSDGLPLIAWLVAIAVVVIGGGYLLLRFLADQ